MAGSQREINFEVVIVGAGISGIIAAHRYLQAHPECHLTVLEKEHCVGGVFERLYDEFWTQWTVGIAEYSDMPMERPPEEDCRNDCFKAKYTTEYLERYVDQMSPGGRSLRDRVQFGIHVQSIEKAGVKWLLLCTDSSNGPITFSGWRLMLANGENSLPNLPDLPGRELFEGVILHSEQFGASTVISDQTVKNVAVIGAGKSSADMIYECLKAQKTVSWIIRKTGAGAGFFAPIDLKTPYRNGVEAAQTRIMSSLQPSLLNQDSWWTWFLHNTNIGVWLVTKIFSILDTEIRKCADYKGRKSTKGFEKLEYDTDVFWHNGTGGAVHHDDFWALVAENVSVFRGDVKMLNMSELYLKDGTHFPCNAVLCGTGWKPGVEVFHKDLLIELGLPHRKEDDYEMAAKWEKLLTEADEKITKKFPLLANPPEHQHTYLQTTPYRLYNSIAPLNDDSILFMNHITAGNKFFAAEAQAMWAVAYFDNHITLPSTEDREKEIAAWIAWCRRRYLSNGERGNFAAFDSVFYVDKLLKDMGAKAHLKGWWRDTFEPFKPGDLGNVWKEYLDLFNK
ncbi:FAD-dependent monooxygenase DEP4 [Lachnellula suecica]|uniref:FAD-dependent monooxygenase DEP4 n=1 Tax=Lachnellula suecica TaxID=602035 RepID=A0A8T9CGS5_9HELO|nr:FAD-dependent monooxygenase DEP4 [Lachnellula suecica]